MLGPEPGSSWLKCQSTLSCWRSGSGDGHQPFLHPESPPLTHWLYLHVSFLDKPAQPWGSGQHRTGMLRPLLTLAAQLVGCGIGWVRGRICALGNGRDGHHQEARMLLRMASVLRPRPKVLAEASLSESLNSPSGT